MTETEALRVVSWLVAGTNGWDDPKVTLWVRKLQKLTNPGVAHRVADRILDTHTSPGAPLWATFLSAYQGEIRNSMLGLPEAPVDRTSLAECIGPWKDAAQRGDREAGVLVLVLERIDERREHRDGRPRWAEALRPPTSRSKEDPDAH